MQKPCDIEETASRANDQKPEHAPADNYGGNVSDGKDQDVAQGGKRRGPGRWVNPETSGD